MVRLTDSNIKQGLMKSQYSGNHEILNQDKPQFTFKQDSDKKKVHFSRDLVEYINYDTRTSDRRGKKSMTTFRGDEPLDWTADEFGRKAGSLSYDSGMAQGGTNFDPQKVKTKYDKKERIGNGVINTLNLSKTVNKNLNKDTTKSKYQKDLEREELSNDFHFNKNIFK